MARAGRARRCSSASGISRFGGFGRSAVSRPAARYSRSGAPAHPPAARWSVGPRRGTLGPVESVLVAAVSFWYLVGAGYAASVGVDAIRTRAYAPQLGLEVRGGAAVAAGWVTLVLATALLAAGLYVSFIAARP